MLTIYLPNNNKLYETMTFRTIYHGVKYGNWTHNIPPVDWFLMLLNQPSSSYSLNNILAKGRNNMNKLLIILLRWSMYKLCYHTDVRKMYNTIKLTENHWCLQRYLWQNELSLDRPPDQKVIKTLIYGVKSCGLLLEISNGTMPFLIRSDQFEELTSKWSTK